MLTIMRDESIIVLADWLKIRGSLKNWVKVYAVLKPGIMLLYKSDKLKPGQWIGTIILNSCQLLERPSKKHGFCFKLFHPLEKSIWASKGPANETYINVPYMLLPTFYLIFRASSETIGQIWMDAIELTLRSSHLLKPTNSLNVSYNSQLNKTNDQQTNSRLLSAENISTSLGNEDIKVTRNQSFTAKLSPNLSLNRAEITKSMSSLYSAGLMSKKCLQEIEVEKKHFNEMSSYQPDETIQTDSDGAKLSSDDVCSLNSSNNDEFFENQFVEKSQEKEVVSDVSEKVFEESKYVISPSEEFGEVRTITNTIPKNTIFSLESGKVVCLVSNLRVLVLN